jgi:hypothetical protein
LLWFFVFFIYCFWKTVVVCVSGLRVFVCVCVFVDVVVVLVFVYFNVCLSILVVSVFTVVLLPKNVLTRLASSAVFWTAVNRYAHHYCGSLNPLFTVHPLA